MAELGPLARLQLLQNSGSWMFMLRVITLSVQDRHWQKSKKKYYRECRLRSSIKSVCISALTGSVQQKMAESGRGFQHHADFLVSFVDWNKFAAAAAPTVMQLVTQFELWLSRRDVDQSSVSLTAALKRKRKTLLSPGHVSSRRSRRLQLGI